MTLGTTLDLKNKKLAVAGLLAAMICLAPGCRSTQETKEVAVKTPPPASVTGPAPSSAPPPSAPAPEPENIAPPILPGERAEGVTLQTPDGASKRLDENFSGRASVLFYWSPDDPNSVDQARALNALSKENPDGLFVASVVNGKLPDQAPKAEKTLKEIGADFPVFLDADLTSAQRFRAYAIPCFALIDKNGVYAVTGYFALDRKIRNLDVRDFIGKLNKGEKIPAYETVPVTDREAETRALIGSPAPDFKLPDGQNHEQSPAFYRGNRNVVVLIWNPECSHCQKELPRVEAFYRANKDALRFEVLAVAAVRNPGQAKLAADFTTAEGLTFPVLLDAADFVMKQYRINSYPYAIFIDRNGVVRETLSGEIANLEAVYRDLFALLNAS